MCEICRRDPCDPRCPNADDTANFHCASCGEDIYVGDDDAVRDSEGNVFCNDECMLAYYGRAYVDWTSIDDF